MKMIQTNIQSLLGHQNLPLEVQAQEDIFKRVVSQTTPITVLII